MSFIRPIIRLCTIAAIRDRTWCDDRVFDSDNTPLAEALVKYGDEAKPYCVVYTDNDNREARGTDVLRCVRRHMNLTLEIGLAGAIKETTEEGTVIKLIEFPHTDAAMEMYIDVVESQVFNALFADPQSEWGELMRRLINNVEKANSQRGGQSERGIRWSARQIVFTCETLADQPMGTSLVEGSPILEFFRMAKGNEYIAPGAAIIERMMNSLPTYPDWEQDQAWMGSTKYGLRAIGMAPLTHENLHLASPYGRDIVKDDRRAPDLSDITVLDEDRGVYRKDGSVFKIIVKPITTESPNIDDASSSDAIKAVNISTESPDIGEP